MEVTKLERLLVKRKELCEMLSLGANTFYALTRIPGFPQVKITEQLYLYDPQEVSLWLKDKSQNEGAVLQ
jgi:predicted DNA-binding transcriptional regulator AlpA